MSFPIIRTAFVAGEISPELYGNVSLEKFSVAATTMRNMAVSFKGGTFSRPGTKYCLMSLTSYTSGFQPRVMRYQFNTQQGFSLEAGAGYFRFFQNGAPILETEYNISLITRAGTAVVTAPGHNFSNGDWVRVALVNGMTQVNNRYFLVTGVSGSSFNLQSLFLGTGINSTGYSPYVSGGEVARVYTLGTPYAGGDVGDLKFTQSADVMSITHPSYPPYELSRVTNSFWNLIPATIGSALAAPASTIAAATVQPSGASSPPTLPAAYAYVVTAVDGNGNESVASPIANIVNGVDMAVTAGSNIIDWLQVVGASYYNVYRAPTSYNTLPGNAAQALPVPAGAIFSYVGFSYGSQFIDSNIIADTTHVPPLNQNPFVPGQVTQIIMDLVGSGYSTASISITSATGSGFSAYPILLSGQIFGWIITSPGGNYQPGDAVTITGDGNGAAASFTLGPASGTYPSVVGYLQQRRVYANTTNQPDTYFMSVPGQYLNFNSGVPSEANDAIIGTPWSQQVNGIQWLVQVSGVLVALTGSGLWQVTGTGGSPLSPQPITPSTQQALAQNFSGVSDTVEPIQIKNEILYVDALGYVAWSAVYSYFTNNFPTTDLTVLSGHLLFGLDVTRWAWCEQPYKIIWAIRCDGVLLSLTYLKEQEVAGWGRHDTQGQFISVASVREPPIDAAYFVTLRQMSYGPVFFIERMDNRIWQGAEEPWCVDNGLAYPQPAPGVNITANTLTGAVTFTADSAVFSADNSTGAVLRIGGGIATITSVASGTSASGVWNLPPGQFAPFNSL